MYSLIRICIVFALLAPSLVHAATLGIPGDGANLSGVGVISGWKCEAEGNLTIVFNDDGKHIPLLYGTERTDVRMNGQCLNTDHDNVGFVAIWNWGNLGDGEHTAVAYDNGVKFAESTFEVVTFGTDFLREANTQVSVPNFPATDETSTFAWNQSTQHLELKAVREGVGPEDLNDLLEPIRQKYELPALAGGIVHAGELIGLGAVGVRRVGSPEWVTVQDRWRLFSCTKAMTATLIGLLVDEGVLSWQTTIGEVFPDLLGSIDAAWQAVTVEQLLSHRAGLPWKLFFDLYDPENPPTTGPMIEQRLDIVELSLQAPPIAAPGSHWQYSHVSGYIIAGAIAEAVTGQSWEALMAERLFVPLGMASADFGPTEKIETNAQPHGHMGNTPIDEKTIGHERAWAVSGPAGQVHSSIADWGKFVALHLAGARGESDFLTPETFQKLQTPAEAEPGASENFARDLGVVWSGNYALGWWVAERRWADGPILYHQGGDQEWWSLTRVYIAPHKDVAVLLATNSNKVEALEEVAWTLIQHFLGK